LSKKVEATPPALKIFEDQKIRSSLEGRSNPGSYDSPFFDPGSTRPMKPRVDPFKKFENLPSSRLGFRQSFDMQAQPLQG